MLFKLLINFIHLILISFIMKSVAFIFCSLLSASVWAAKPYSFEQVIGLSDLIVIGEIENVEENTFTFKIEETLKGKVNASISVVKTDECERYARYEKGQKLCLFLRKGLLSWSIIDGNQGERPILDETIYLCLDENYKLPLDEFSEAIVAFCCNFKTRITMNGYSYSQKVYFIQDVSEDELNAFRNKNKFTRWLYGQITYDEVSMQ